MVIIGNVLTRASGEDTAAKPVPPWYLLRPTHFRVTGPPQKLLDWSKRLCIDPPALLTTPPLNGSGWFVKRLPYSGLIMVRTFPWPRRPVTAAGASCLCMER